MSAVIICAKCFPRQVTETLSSGKISHFYHAKKLLSNLRMIFQPLGLRTSVSALLSANATLPASHQAHSSALPLAPLPIACRLSHGCEVHVNWTTAIKCSQTGNAESNVIPLRLWSTLHVALPKGRLTS